VRRTVTVKTGVWPKKKERKKEKKKGKEGMP